MRKRLLVTGFVKSGELLTQLFCRAARFVELKLTFCRFGPFYSKVVVKRSWSSRYSYIT